MKLSLISLSILAIASCTAGDFCAVYEPVYFSTEVAPEVFKLDKAAATTLAANNAYAERVCK